MAIKYHHPGWIFLGLVVLAAVAAAALVMRGRLVHRAGLRAANTERFRALPEYKRIRLEGRLLRSILAAGLAVSIAASLFLAGRPYRKEPVKDDVTRRDIFLCMDLSLSSCPGADAIAESVAELVPELDGDQLGISLFNTSSMQYVPVTGDYKFILQRLDELGGYFRAEEEFKEQYADLYEYVHEIPEGKRARYEELNTILSLFDRGTTAGYESKGTSCTGEGLASCLFSFPELYTEERTRIILFVTDNLAEYAGEALVTLEEVADMCVQDGVVVYGIYPNVDPSAADGAEEAKAQMRSAVERTGGLFYEYRETSGAEEILASIKSREQIGSKTAVATHDADAPEFWTAVLVVGLVLSLGCVVFLLVKTGLGALAGLSRGAKLRKGGFAAALCVCLVLILLRPVLPDADAEIRTNNLDVCFVIDTTISMWAEDHDGGETRISGVRKDIAEIMEHLPGSSFSLVSFDNGAQILAPYTQNISALQDCLDVIHLPPYATAEGSSLNTAYNALRAMIQASEERSGRRKTIVFLFSDGEITDGSELMSFRDLRAGIDDGAVLGYGSASGGRMNYPGRGYLQDTSSGTDARSIPDEETLQAVAKDLGLNYIRRTEGGSQQLTQSLSRIRTLSRNSSLRDGDRTAFRELYPWSAAILSLLLTVWLFRLLYKGSVV